MSITIWQQHPLVANLGTLIYMCGQKELWGSFRIYSSLRIYSIKVAVSDVPAPVKYFLMLI